MATFLLSAGWALLSGVSYYLAHRGSALQSTGVNASVLGGAVFLVTFFILSFLGGILLSVLDAGETLRALWQGLLRARLQLGFGGQRLQQSSSLAARACPWPNLQRVACAAKFFSLLYLPLLFFPVFVCWAIDLDSNTVSHEEIYAVFAAVPVPGRVVEQPDGNIAYGAGQQQQGGGAYQPPNVATV